MIGLDRRVERWIVLHRAGWLDPVFEALSWIGALGAIWLAIALLAALLRGRRGLLVGTVAAVLLAEGASRLLQWAVGRDRPPLRLPAANPLVQVPSTGSFPSGHATVAFAAATVLALAVARPRFTCAVALLAAAISFSRLYVGVHYPLDVLGGAALGMAIGAVAAMAFRLAPRRRRLRSRRAAATGAP